MVKTYIQIPKRITAVQWNGDNENEIRQFSSMIVNRYSAKRGDFSIPMLVINRTSSTSNMYMYIGDYMVSLGDDFFYIVRQKDFENNYIEQTQIRKLSNGNY